MCAWQLTRVGRRIVCIQVTGSSQCSTSMPLHTQRPSHMLPTPRKSRASSVVQRLVDYSALASPDTHLWTCMCCGRAHTRPPNTAATSHNTGTVTASRSHVPAPGHWHVPSRLKPRHRPSHSVRLWFFWVCSVDTLQHSSMTVERCAARTGRAPSLRVTTGTHP